MEFTAQQIAELLNGKVEGDKNAIVNTFSKIEEGKAGSLCFLANPKYTNYIYETEASVVLVNNDFEAQKPIKASLIRVEDAYKSIAILLDIYNQMTDKPKGIEKQSFIHKSAVIGKNIYVGAFAYIAKDVKIGNNVLIYPGVYIGNNVTIGDNCVFHPGVKIYHNTKIGNNCIIHSGSVIGADGFGFAPNNGEEFVKIAQIGNVIIEDNVELGALVTVDRATMGSTIIRKGVKLDNQNHIAHNVEIGENTVIAAQSGLAGTSKIGKNCMFGGQVGIGPHITIANGTKLSAQSGVPNNVLKEDSILMGAPAFDIRAYHRAYVHFKNLDDIVKRLENLEKKLKEK
ncbi:MAG: UDP-3-O-(3-hydroxymyristoyl)glucosamine N-acyltransferase [Bacteroidales bacterium]|jgi:UDP-3-O-[3-hydroxymyristoyl] glucosamine N-acyltransferase|nr:UDP-3-O-(3-hydroxymyristoyl)glucosamine N-acyltransferase [Bacteroidales bacterium]MCK9498493.1 UDP-3-O-(3-hydroxymyristoyl)glucosamine N-acyltransferase [Bacteroidales bacterium]MDY0314119.1 UDP-3-O-(3-hydroxymyristoyl)glucosamine N-acyltransferase [Bacteroidales bacterium]NLB87099.1 UDP-3-O-(3-hydroxymyristoyl)glucosamine N-acyltransferase [Bacteroidales bacterium]